MELQRYLLDLSLQPIESFGVLHIEQYLLSALRYQLNYTCYALALAQYNFTPAFTGYLTEAQANTIEKMRDKRVWGYWAHECLVGYQRWNPIRSCSPTSCTPVSWGHAGGVRDPQRPAVLRTGSADAAVERQHRVRLRVRPSLCEAIVHNMDISGHGRCTRASPG